MVQFKNVVTWLFTNNFIEQQDKMQELVTLRLKDPHPTPPHAYVEHIHVEAEHEALDRLHQIKAPTMCLVGREDTLTPVKFSKQLAERIPHSTLRIVEGYGHGLHIEGTQQFVSAVKDFLLSS
jgi:pimeloyl-ACP methyl ester carboxylesterase